RQRRDQADEALGGEGAGDEGSRGAALEQRRQADPRRKRGEAVVQSPRQQLPQIGTEGAQYPAVDHVQAPQQQRHATHQVEKNDTSHQALLPDLSRKIRLSPNDSGSIVLLVEMSENLDGDATRLSIKAMA